MTALAALALPPAAAFAGDRLNRLVLGKSYEGLFGIGARFALGLATGMLVFSQVLLLAVLAGVNVAGPLAWAVLVWGWIEFCLLVPGCVKSFQPVKFQPGYLWCLLLLPVAYFFRVIGQLSVVEGTLEFDAVAFWVLKAKILYLAQGRDFIDCIHQSNLSYAHWDYPLLVPGLYTLGYGLMGHVDEFVNKVWPLWMVVALALAILSLGNVWKRPHALPFAAVLLLCYLPATVQFIRWEGATIPMVFYTGLASLLVTTALMNNEPAGLVAAVPVFAGCAGTKFEGIVFAAVWGACLVFIGWRRRWFKTPRLRPAAIVACSCLIPYALFRLAKPVAHFESGWWKSGLESPGVTLTRFPQVWFLNLCSRFFGPDFAQWQAGDKGGLVWTGHWTSLGSLVNKELTVLPWLILVLLAIALFKARNRFTVLLVSGASLAVFTVLALVIASLNRMQADVANVIDFATNVVGRYYYPFLMAWFLGLVAVWFADHNEPAPETKPAPAPAPKKKKK